MTRNLANSGTSSILSFLVLQLECRGRCPDCFVTNLLNHPNCCRGGLIGRPWCFASPQCFNRRLAYPSRFTVPTSDPNRVA